MAFTNNNLLWSKDGSCWTATVLDIVGEHLDAPGYDCLACSADQKVRSGIITSVVLYSCRSQRCAQTCFVRLKPAEMPGHAWASIIAAGLVPVCHRNSCDKLAIESARLLAKPGLPYGCLSSAGSIEGRRGLMRNAASNLAKIIEIAHNSTV